MANNRPPIIDNENAILLKIEELKFLTAQELAKIQPADADAQYQARKNYLQHLNDILNNNEVQTSERLDNFYSQFDLIKQKDNFKLEQDEYVQIATYLETFPENDFFYNAITALTKQNGIDKEKQLKYLLQLIIAWEENLSKTFSKDGSFKEYGQDEYNLIYIYLLSYANLAELKNLSELLSTTAAANREANIITKLTAAIDVITDPETYPNKYIKKDKDGNEINELTRLMPIILKTHTDIFQKDTVLLASLNKYKQACIAYNLNLAEKCNRELRALFTHKEALLFNVFHDFYEHFEKGVSFTNIFKDGIKKENFTDEEKIEIANAKIKFDDVDNTNDDLKDKVNELLSTNETIKAIQKKYDALQPMTARLDMVNLDEAKKQFETDFMDFFIKNQRSIINDKTSLSFIISLGIIPIEAIRELALIESYKRSCEQYRIEIVDLNLPYLNANELAKTENRDVKLNQDKYAAASQDYDILTGPKLEQYIKDSNVAAIREVRQRFEASHNKHVPLFRANEDKAGNRFILAIKQAAKAVVTLLSGFTTWNYFWNTKGDNYVKDIGFFRKKYHQHETGQPKPKGPSNANSR